MRKIYCIDLDDTICFPNHDFKDAFNKYYKAAPNVDVIKKINELYDSGNKIIIFTARRMLTFDGDLKKIKKDVEKITIDWLSQNSVKYSELLFGKPYADYYVDDKATTLNTFLNE